MSHWFGIRPGDVDEMPYGEIEEYVGRLRKLPPIGAVVVVTPKER